jgi:hypothetical protein
MNHEIIDKLLNHWRANFFTESILIAAFIFCFIIGLLYHYNEKERIFFLAYFFIGVILFVVANPIDFLRILTGKKLVIFSEISNTIFELVEFIAFYYFFKKCFQNKKIKKISKIFLICLCIFIAAFFTGLIFPDYTIENIRNHSLFINVIEFFFLAVMCLTYFYELLTGIPKINLFQRPSFFITTSTFFYSVLSIPFFMIAWDIRKIEKSFYFILFSCHYIVLTILLLTISKAFLCRKPITT